MPIVKKAKGFVRYYWLDTGKGEGASVGVFNDKAGADESVHLAADYVQKDLSKLLHSEKTRDYRGADQSSRLSAGLGPRSSGLAHFSWLSGFSGSL